MKEDIVFDLRQFAERCDNKNLVKLLTKAADRIEDLEDRLELSCMEIAELSMREDS